MRNYHTKRALTFGVVASLAVACGAQSNETDSEDTSTTPTGVVTSGTSSSTTVNKVGSASSVADLKLAGALAITLPEAFGGKAAGSSLALLAGKKSQEACMMGMTISEETRSLGEVGGFFCHLEVEKDRMKFGKKYKIMTSFGEFARLFVDNSQASSGKLTIGFCSSHRESDGSSSRSHQLITIDSLTETGPKGSIISSGTGTYQGTAQTYGRSQSFDMSVAGVVSVLGKTMHSHSGNTFVREVNFELKKEGTSTLKLANKGSSDNGQFFDRGVAFVSAEKGSAVFQTKGSNQGQTFEFANRSYFNKSGEVLGSGDVNADLAPPVSAIPNYLPSDFKPDPLTGWVGEDCPDFDEEVNLDPESAAHKACEQARESDYDCWTQSTYERSNESVTIN
jgi:hypothetical protein